MTRITIECEGCGKPFTRQWYPSRPRPRACSNQCVAALNRRAPFSGTCEWCGKPFAKTAASRKKPPRFCNRSCSMLWQTSQPGYSREYTLTPARLKAIRGAGEKARTSQAMATYLASDRNPFLDPSTRAKSHATLARQGWPQLRGGNGTGPTIPQARLHELLGEPWELELAIRTGMKRGSGYPGAYKADIGHQGLKIAIEVHGNGHGKNGNPRDRKKRELLESLGWTVLWIWNKQILDGPCGTLRQVQATISQTGC